ncbi:TonB-dependent siderophore receptor [Pseudomonas brenneri]|uniref:TonB-dependent siderophore receptor n=1 Tax=Pseudomonas brenneri TaxID=129817 RepID=UPI0035711469
MNNWPLIHPSPSSKPIHFRRTAQQCAVIASTLTLCAYQMAHADDLAQRTSENDPIPPVAGVLTLPATSVTGVSTKGGESGLVHGYVAEQSGLGTKTDTSILEIPQSVSVVTREQMDTQQIKTTSQALRYTTGANSEKYGAFGDQLDFTKIRGVEADYYLDGLRLISNPGSWSPQVDPYTLERVEVLRGPSSYLYGQSTGGGIVNQVTRKPQEVESHEVTTQFGSFDRTFLGVDSTGPIDSDRTLLYRFTATGLKANDQVEDVRHKRLYLAPSLTWQPTEQTSWTVQLVHSREPEIPNYNSLPANLLGLNKSPYPSIDRDRNYRDMSFDDSSREQNYISSNFTHSFDNDWKVTSTMRYMHIASDLQRSVVYGYSVVNGKPLLKNTYEISPSSSNTFSMDNYVSGSLQLGPTKHDVIVGADFASGTVSSALYSSGPYLVDPYGSDYRPHVKPDFTASRAAPWSEKQEFDRLGLYVQDQISYDRWRLTLGTRYDKSETDDVTRSYSPTSVSTRMNNGKWSGRTGLSFQFDNGISPYVSYATSFNPLIGSGYNGSAFVPTETTQSEIGIKFHPADSRTLLTAAIYNLEQTNVKTADAAHLGFNTQAGKVRSRGVDLSATAELVENLNLLASYSYLDNALVQDTTYQGNSLTQTPRHSAALWLDYLIGRGSLSGLKIGAGSRYLGASYGDPANTFKVPAVTLFDLALNYELGSIAPSLEGASLALNVSNLTNKEYVASCTSAMYCFVGQDRTATTSLTYRW